MDTAELVKLAIAVVGIALVLFVLRRASLASQRKAASARERLDLVPEEVPQKRLRRRPRPGQPEPKAPIVDEPLEPDEGDCVGLAEVKTCLMFACEMENGRVAVNGLTPGTRNVIAAW